MLLRCACTSDKMLVVLPLLGQARSILHSAWSFTILPPHYLYLYTAMPDILCTSPAAQGLARDLLGADMLSQAHLVVNFDYTELLQNRGSGSISGVPTPYLRTQCLLMEEAKRYGPVQSVYKPRQQAAVLVGIAFNLGHCLYRCCCRVVVLGMLVSTRYR